MANGALIPIEDVQVDDYVFSRNPITGELSINRVVQLFVTSDRELLEVEVETADGAVEVFETTPEHPFFDDHSREVLAKNLRPGDTLAPTINGETGLTVRQVRGSPKRATVYNFEVENDHTYFVGQTGVWVHNECTRDRVLANIAESRKARVGRNVAQSRNARRGSNFGEHAARDRGIQKTTEGGASPRSTGSSESVDLFRGVSPEEFDDIFRFGGFRSAPGSEGLIGKQFGLKLEEVLKFSDHFPEVAAVVKVRIPKSTFDQLDFSRSIDPFIFRNGVITAQPGRQLDLLNDTIEQLDQAF
ncbi:MAG: polymorphic toxin-type HINT domain-containing protein [Acidobacteriota bacterium]